MLKLPRKIIFFKPHNLIIKKKNAGLHNLQTLGITLKAQENGKLQQTQIESLRRTLRRNLGRRLKFRNLVFPLKPVTSKAMRVRMGSGKGTISGWILPIHSGQPFYTIHRSLQYKSLITALQQSKYKLRISSKIQII
jgi:large subunit ribosomal protein L16